MTKWGIIGSGKIAGRFAGDLAHVPEAKLIGVFSRNLNNSETFAQTYSATACKSLEDLMRLGPDIVYVATPHPAHCAMVLACLEGRMPVLCEKPFAMNAAETRAMIDTARAKKVFLMEAMWTRYFPAIESMLRAIRSGEIGRIESLDLEIGFAAQFDPRSRLFDPALGGGSLLDIGVYPISFAHMVMGESPSAIESRVRFCATGVDEEATWSMSYSNGTIVRCLSTVTRVPSNQAVIRGSDGEIRVPRFWWPECYVINGMAREFPYQGHGLRFEATEVGACLAAGLFESPRWPLSATLEVMMTLDRIRSQWGLRYPGESIELFT